MAAAGAVLSAIMLESKPEGAEVESGDGLVPEFEAAA